MTSDGVLVLVLLATTILLLVTQLVRIEVTSLGLIVVLGLSGVLSPAEALGGFSSEATLTVVAMLVLSAGLERTGIVDYVSHRLALGASEDHRRMIVLLAAPAVLFSAFMNNTPVVALMIPVALGMAKRFGIPASKLLIPVSYASILGGTCTLIGTSTNILVDSLSRKAGGPGFGMFEFTALGIVYVALGLGFLVAFGPRLLPRRTALNELLAASAPGNYVTEIVIRAPSRYIGARLGDLFGRTQDVVVLELVREERAHVNPDPEICLAEGDVLLVESDARAIHSLLASKGVEQGTVVADEERIRVQRVDLRVAETVVTPNSSFVDAQVKELGLSRKYGVQVLGIRRLGRHHQQKLRDWKLRSGDVLLVQGEPESLRLLQEEGDVLLVEGVQQQITLPSKAPVAVGVIGLVIVLASIGAAPVVFLALAGVAALLLTRTLDLREVIRAVDPSVLFLLAGTIPLGRAMETTGVAAAFADATVATFGPHGPWILIAGFYLMTSLMTEVVSNNATAVLLTPIALRVAATTGIDPKPLLIAIAFGASASFATPIGYQTNTLVMGPGGYLFRDYLRVGLPMNLVMAVAAAMLIPLFWPPG